MNEPIKKPIVFFSHSSKDEKPLRKLKDLIDDKTKGSVIIFLTSDGQSIPFGRNWVHKIEEALDNSSLMFVFVSPNSLQSNWIYFEAGYAYSKKIRVIPVGVSGIDLAKTHPPLSLLQGFNLDKSDKFGNIIAIINETYELKCDPVFDGKVFADVFSKDNVSTDNIVSSFVIWLEVEDIPDFIDKLARELEVQKLNPTKSKNLLIAAGLQVGHEPGRSIRFSIDGILLGVYLPILQKILEDKNIKLDTCILFIEPGRDFIHNFQRITALLKDTDISIANSQNLKFQGIEFRLEDHYGATEIMIRIIADARLITIDWIAHVNQILIETGVIFSSPVRPPTI